MERKKVAHFVRRLLPTHTSFIRNQIAAHSDYEPLIIHKYLVKSGFSEELLSKYASLHLDSERIGLEKRWSDVLCRKFLALEPSDVLNALRFLQNQRADILHLHYGTDAGLFSRIIELSNLPSVVSFYGYDCSSFPRRLMGLGKRYLQQNVFRKVTKILAMSPDMEKDLISLGCPADKIVVHYYGTDTGPFYMERDYEDKPRIDFLIVSGLVPQKGHMFLLKAFEKAFSCAGKEIYLHIVGEGELEEELQSYIMKRGLRNVFMHGAVRYLSEEHLTFLKNADVFIHPSVTDTNGDKEGIPGSLIEAMASGLPVISTYHAGIPYVIEDGVTGLLAKEWDVDGLAEHMRHFAEDAEYRKHTGTKGRMAAIERLDLREKEKELERIYDSLVQ